MKFKRLLSVVLTVAMLMASFASLAVIGMFTAVAADPVTPVHLFDIDNNGLADTGTSNYHNISLKKTGGYVTATPVSATTVPGEYYYYLAGGRNATKPAITTGAQYVAIKYRAASVPANAYLRVYADSDGVTAANSSQELKVALTQATSTAAGEGWVLEVFDLADLTTPTLNKSNYALSFLRIDPIWTSGGNLYNSNSEMHIAWVGLFNSEEDAKAYDTKRGDPAEPTPGDTTMFFDTVDFSDSIWNGETQLSGWMGSTLTENAGVYTADSYNEKYIVADSTYAFTMNITEVGAEQGKNFMFVRGIRAFSFGDQGYHGAINHNATTSQNGQGGVNTAYAGCAGVYLVPVFENGSMTALNIRFNCLDRIDGAYSFSPKKYNVSATSTQITVVDDGETLSILSGDELIAVITLTGTQDYDYHGTDATLVDPAIAADACAATVSIKADGIDEVVTNAIVASTYASELGFAVRDAGNKLVFSDMSVKPAADVTVPAPDFECPHEYTYKYDADSHWQVCQREGCTESTDKVAHSGGTATTICQAQCETCGAYYGNLAQVEDETVDITFRGIQNTDFSAETFAVRFIATVDSTNYQRVGFYITEANNGVELDTSTDTVYTAINSSTGNAYTAAELGGKYITAIVIKGIPAGTALNFTVTPYVIDMDGQKQEGAAYTVTITSEGVVTYAQV